MSRTTMLSRISSTWLFTISPSSIDASVPLYSSIMRLVLVRRVLVFVVELGAAVGKRAKLGALRVALFALAAAVPVAVGVSSSGIPRG